MYKFLLCLRMLRQRRITWLCVAGVALGLGTLIVVHSVMGGFAGEVRDRIKGTLADMSISRGQSGFLQDHEILTPDGIDTVDVIEVVRGVKGVAAASPVLEGLALIKIPDPELGRDFTRWCYFWGIDPAAEAQVSRFAEWLNEGEGRDGATVFHLGGTEDEPPIVLGCQLATARIKQPDGHIDEKRLKEPGDTVVLVTVTFRSMISATSYLPFTVVDTWKSGMAELDSQMAFIPLQAAQSLRSMPGRITKIHVRLEDYNDHEAVAHRLHEALAAAGLPPFIITTWEDERSTLLSAVAMERNLLVILLFLEIVVAGFGIMAILFMIVAEKTRDIGIIRALGGSRNGVAWIFLAFGLGIGVIGCILGTAAGLLFTDHINAIEGLVARVTGYHVFSRDIYYFDRIPTAIDPVAILWFVLGALGVCVGASAFPARRAARLTPVDAIRYE